MKLVSFAFIISVFALTTGCGKSDSDKGGSAKATGGGGSAKAAAGPLKITKLGLEADAPGGSKVGDGPLGDGAMIQGPGIVVAIEEAGEMSSATLAEAKEDADMYSPKNMKEEKLDDGWLLTFENTGGMGTNYWVKSRRTIGGKAYTCDTTASDATQQKNAVAACKSLRAAK
jgi:hypothetical protein